MSELDNQLDDYFSGTEKTRTILSGTWRDLVASVLPDTWQIVSAWQDDEMIYFTIQSPEQNLSVHAVNEHLICLDEALKTIALIIYRTKRPYRVLLSPDWKAPDKVVHRQLWKQLANAGIRDIEAQYIELGGRFYD